MLSFVYHLLTTVNNVVLLCNRYVKVVPHKQEMFFRVYFHFKTVF